MLSLWDTSGQATNGDSVGDVFKSAMVCRPALRVLTIDSNSLASSGQARGNDSDADVFTFMSLPSTPKMGWKRTFHKDSATRVSPWMCRAMSNFDRGCRRVPKSC